MRYDGPDDVDEFHAYLHDDDGEVKVVGISCEEDEDVGVGVDGIYDDDWVREIYI